MGKNFKSPSSKDRCEGLRIFLKTLAHGPSCNEPKSRKLVRRAPSAKRRAKLSKQTAPRKSEKNSRRQTVLQILSAVRLLSRL